MKDDHKTCSCCDINHNHEHSIHHSYNHGEHEEKENRTLKIVLIIISAVLLGVGILYEKLWSSFEPETFLETLKSPQFYILLVAFLLVGYEVILNAIKNLFKGNLFDENFLMSVASIAAFFVAEYDEAVIVMLLYQIGELLQDIAVDKSHKSVEQILNMKEIVVHKVVNDKEVDSKVTDIKIDDVIVVKPGERIPLDGLVIDGEAALDMSPLTGESMPVNKTINDNVLSGSININGLLTIKVTKTYDNSTVSRILECIENSTLTKTKAEKFVTRFAKIYTPIVVGLAILVIFIPPLFSLLTWKESIYKACIFLVVSCPCAIIISVPLAYFIGIGVSSKKGILMKGSNYLEMLNRIDTILFDKTGTLTHGNLRVHELDVTDREILDCIYSLESKSNHPIAKAITTYITPNKIYEVNNFVEKAGKGISGLINGKTIEITNKGENEVQVEDGSVSYVYINGIYVGHFVFKENIKNDTKIALASLKKDGIKTVIVSGDKKDHVENIGSELGVDETHGELLPMQKVEVLDSYQKSGESKVGFVGDGINDAPVIAKSDVGIAMGGAGSDAAIEVSDIVIMNDSLTSLINAKKIAKKTVNIVKTNILAVILVKSLAMIWGLFGDLPMWLAVMSDVGICLLAILNDLRLFKLSK